MDTQQLLDKAVSILKHYSLAVNTPEANRLDIVIAKEKLLQAAEALESSGWGYLSTITGLDHPASDIVKSEEKQWEHVADAHGQTGFGYAGSLEVLYHFCSGAAIITLRVLLSHTEPSIPSICSVIPSATLYERELMEMFGIQVEGSPNTEHLLLPDDWPANVYPLRKDFIGFNDETDVKETKNA